MWWMKPLQHFNCGFVVKVSLLSHRRFKQRTSSRHSKIRLHRGNVFMPLVPFPSAVVCLNQHVLEYLFLNELSKVLPLIVVKG